MQKQIFFSIITMSVLAFAQTPETTTDTSLALEAAPTTIASRNQPCYDMSQQACETFYLTNIQRRKYRLPALTYSRQTYEMAQEQSEDMANRDYFDHTRPRFRDRAAETFSHRASRFGLMQGVGENIAMHPTPQQTVIAWMNSPGHRHNILNPKYRSFGVGYKDGLYTQVFWVIDEAHAPINARRSN